MRESHLDMRTRTGKLSHVNKLENRVSAGFALNYCSGPADWSLSVVYHSSAGAGCQRLQQPGAATNTTLHRTTTRRKSLTMTSCLANVLWDKNDLLLSWWQRSCNYEISIRSDSWEYMLKLISKSRREFKICVILICKSRKLYYDVYWIFILFLFYLWHTKLHEYWIWGERLVLLILLKSMSNYFL